jgi:hypothetical protein
MENLKELALLALIIQDQQYKLFNKWMVFKLEEKD